jgi:hypothetical protein
MFTFKARLEFNFMVRMNKFASHGCISSGFFVHPKHRYRIPSYHFVDFVNHRKTLLMFHNASQ